MLKDTPRKLLLIINHYYRHFGRLPSMPELERLSGRMPVDIRSGMSVLAQENYIEWSPHTPPETAVIIEGWERDNPSHKEVQTGAGKTTGQGYTDYWSQY